jgi:hypothetical protein
LPDLAIFLLGIVSVDIVPNGALVNRLVIVSSAQVQLVVHDALLPVAVYEVLDKFEPVEGSLTSIKHETVNTNLFISVDTNIIDQTFFISHRAKGGHKPTIAITSLAHV